jgi:hypothetical protein
MPVMAAVSSMSSVHEHVQEDTGEQEKPGKQTECVNAMLTEEEESCDRKQGDHCNDRPSVRPD